MENAINIHPSFIARVKAEHERTITYLMSLDEKQQVKEIKNYLDEGDLETASNLLSEFVTRDQKIEELTELIAEADEALKTLNLH